MNNIFYSVLYDYLKKQSKAIDLTPETRIVIFSDLHMGRGNSRDDFLPNSGAFLKILRRYYLARDYSLVLNGDVEELQRNSLDSIYAQWSHVYDLFNEFHMNGRLYKLAGNHDSKLLAISRERLPFPLLESVKINYNGEAILIFHGHQLSLFFERFNEITGFFLRYVGNTLRIKNRSSANDSRRQWKIEKRAYDLSRENQILSIIGHTHRPLFESMSKVDTLRFQIEALCQEYIDNRGLPADQVEREIQDLKNRLNFLLERKSKEPFVTQLYSRGVVVPCLFNSGSVIGKYGITGIEIAEDSVSLVHWPLEKDGTEQNGGSGNGSGGQNGGPGNPFGVDLDPVFAEGWHSEESPFPDHPDMKRRVIKKDHLRNIFTRIHLLA